MDLPTPYGQRVLIMPLQGDKEHPSGLILVSQQDAAFGWGRVVKLSENPADPLSVVEGDEVYYAPSRAQNLRVGAEEYHLVQESELLLKRVPDAKNQKLS